MEKSRVCVGAEEDSRTGVGGGDTIHETGLDESTKAGEVRGAEKI